PPGGGALCRSPRGSANVRARPWEGSPQSPVGGASARRRWRSSSPACSRTPSISSEHLRGAASPVLCQFSISACTRLLYSFCSAAEASCTAQAAPGRACMLLLALLLGPVTNPIYQRTEHCEAHQGRVLGRVERQARRRE